MSWDSEAWEAGVKKHWDEENDDVKDTWDADSDAEPERPPSPPKAVSLKPKSRIDQAIEKREQKELEEKLKSQKAKLVAGTAAEAADEPLEDAVAEKLRRQKLVEESDLGHAEDLFGGSAEPSAVQSTNLEDMQPKTEADFNLFADTLATMLQKHSKSRYYLNFVKNLSKKIVESMESADIKEVAGAVTVVFNDKVKKEREESKGKKKTGPKRATLNVDSAMSHYGADDYSDFV